METAVQIFAAINLGIIGLSHLFRPKPWVEFFLFLRDQGEAGAFVSGMMSLFFGSIIVAFHNVWVGLPAALTVLGWAQILKGLTYLVFPAVGLRKLQRLTPESAKLFRWAGVLLLGFSALLLYHLATG